LWDGDRAAPVHQPGPGSPGGLSVLGLRAEIAARIADEFFEYLDVPVRRVGAKDTFVIYAPQMEDGILPQAEHPGQALLGLNRY
jgi:pyruvate/2-oxoglutarate/acetoin dehydrogenase E1 component